MTDFNSTAMQGIRRRLPKVVGILLAVIVTAVILVANGVSSTATGIAQGNVSSCLNPLESNHWNVDHIEITLSSPSNSRIVASTTLRGGSTDYRISINAGRYVVRVVAYVNNVGPVSNVGSNLNVVVDVMANHATHVMDLEGCSVVGRR